MFRAFLITAALAVGVVAAPQAAHASQLSIAAGPVPVLAPTKVLPNPNPCPFNATTCIPAPEPELPYPGGTEGPGGSQGGSTPGVPATFCDALKASLGASANTPFGQDFLAAAGCS